MEINAEALAKVDEGASRLREDLVAALLMAQLFHSDKLSSVFQELMVSIREGLSNQETINILIERYGERKYDFRRLGR